MEATKVNQEHTANQSYSLTLNAIADMIDDKIDEMDFETEGQRGEFDYMDIHVEFEVIKCEDYIFIEKIWCSKDRAYTLATLEDDLLKRLTKDYPYHAGWFSQTLEQARQIYYEQEVYRNYL